MAARGLSAGVVFLVASAGLYGQAKSGSSPAESKQHLTAVERTEVRSDLAGGFYLPTKCDAEGNIYSISVHDPEMVRKIDRKGKEAISIPSAPVPNVRHLGYFDVDSRGRVHRLGTFEKDGGRYIVHFKPDGSYDSRTKLQPGPGVDLWPVQLASFLSGTWLVAGTVRQYQTDSKEHTDLPFTAIFSSDGALLKEVKLADDKNLHELANKGNKNANVSGTSADRSVNSGSAESAPDGSVYVMRRTAPAIIYAISPGGEVIRRFTVDSGKGGFLPLSPLHISGSRIAVLFDNDHGGQRIKVVSLNGEELGHLRWRGRQKLPRARLGLLLRREGTVYVPGNGGRREELNLQCL